jgi:hypothetical protein
MIPPESQSFQDVLVHYTSAQGLEGILRSNTLWATHSSYTNDEEELQTWKKLLDRFCETRFWENETFKPLFSDLFLVNDRWRETIERLKNVLVKTEKKLKAKS